VAASGGVLAWLTIRPDVLDRAAPDEPVHHYRTCPVSGPPVVEGQRSAGAPRPGDPEAAPVG
jgi:hypothetical protein